MAVSIGKGRYYKLFLGNSQPKRLLIEDIDEPGLLADEYVQGIVVKVYPIKSSERFGRICKLALREDVEKEGRHSQYATINVFLLGDVADEGNDVHEGDRIVLTEAIVECCPTDEHKFQLIVWREMSQVSMWVISNRGKVRANTVNGVDILRGSSENESEVGIENGNDSDEEEHVIYESCEYDFTEQSVDKKQLGKIGGKRKGKFQLGPRGVTPSHVKRRPSNMVVSLNEANDEQVAETLQQGESHTKTVSTCTKTSATEVNNGNVNASIGNTIPSITLPSVAIEANSGQSLVMSQKAGNGQSVSLCVQSAHGTAEQPGNVQCTRIELTPSRVSTRIWTSKGTGLQPEHLNNQSQFGVMPVKDLPQLISPDRPVQSQSTVVESNLTATLGGDNTAANTGVAASAGDASETAATSNEGAATLNEEDTTLRLEDLAEQSGEDASVPAYSCPDEEDQTFMRSRNRVAAADPAPTSSTNTLIPSDYTPVASLLACDKDGGNRSPLRQVLDPERLHTSGSPAAGPSHRSPSPGLSPVRVRKRSSRASSNYTVPPGYTTLAHLRPETTVNVYGVVKLFKPVWKCRGTDLCSVVMLMDPTAAESDGLECLSFQPSASRLPSVHKVGDIVRLHRIKITRYQGKLQAKSSRGFASVVFDRDTELPVTAEMARVSSSTFTLTQSDIETVESLKNWCEDHPVLFPPSNFLSVSQINPDCYFDLVCEVLGIALHRTLDCVVLYVTDGTQPEYDLRNCEGSDFKLVEPLSRGSIQDDNVISVFLYGSHAEMAHLLAQKDEYVILHNVHSQVLKRGGSGCSVLDVVKPYLELCLHRGTAFGRGLSVLSPDSQEVMQVKRRQGVRYRTS